MSFPPVLSAISILGHKWVNGAYDEVETIVDHRAVQTKEADRDFFGVIQPASPEDLEILPEGDRTRELITIHTREVFSIADKSTDRQTFINYSSAVYKVAAGGNWTQQGFRRYVATSYKVR